MKFGNFKFLVGIRLLPEPIPATKISYCATPCAVCVDKYSLVIVADWSGIALKESSVISPKESGAETKPKRAVVWNVDTDLIRLHLVCLKPRCK